MLGFIYTAQNQINGKCYVGQTQQALDRRWKKHIETAMRKPNTLFTRAIRKHGPQAFFVTQVAECSTKAELDRKETLFIIALRATDPKFGYNCTFGGEGAALTPEIRERQAAKLRGRTIPQEQRDRISKALTGRVGVRRGMKTPEATKEKLRALTGDRSSMFGRKHSDATKKLMSAKALGNQRRLGMSNSEHQKEVTRKRHEAKFIKTIAWG